MSRLTLCICIFMILNIYAGSERWEGELGGGEQATNPFDSFEPAEGSARVTLGAQCGKINLKSSLEGAINNVFSRDFLSQTADILVQAAPMVAVCYFDDTACQVIQNTQLVLQGIAKFRLNQCAVIDKYVSKQSQIAARRKADCIAKARKVYGDENKALESCNKTLSDKFESLVGDGKLVKEQNLVESALRWAGFGDEESLGEASTILPETVATADTFKISYDKKKSIPSPYKKEYLLKKKLHKDLCINIIGEMKTQKKVSSVQIISPEDLNNKYAGMIDIRTLDSLASLPADELPYNCDKLASIMAKKVIFDLVSKTREKLLYALQNPNIKEEATFHLNKKMALLTAYFKENQDVGFQFHTLKNKIANVSDVEIKKSAQKYSEYSTKAVIQRSITNSFLDDAYNEGE